MVRNLSKRLKGTNFGISRHYPPEVPEKGKKLIPVMLKERHSLPHPHLDMINYEQQLL
jgi:hypothetical protein